MIKKLVIYGLIGFGAYYAFKNLDFKATKPVISKAEQYKADKEIGISILRGYCDSYVGNLSFKECNDPRYMPLIKTSKQFSPAVVKRWQETFFEDFCKPESSRSYESDNDSWCKQYWNYTYETNEGIRTDYGVSRFKKSVDLQTRFAQHDVRKKWFLEDGKYRHACYYYKQKPAVQREYTACPESALRNLDVETKDWAIIN